MARLIPIALLPLVVAASPAAAQRLGGGGDLNISLSRIVIALVLCLMLAGLAILLLKRGGGRVDLAALRKLVVAMPARRRIDVIETRRVSQHADLCLFRCDDEEYLVLCAQHHQTVLRRTDRVCAVDDAFSPEDGA